ATLNRETDTLLIDTSAGLNDGVLNFCTAAHEIVLVVCNEPASVADAYAMIKVMNLDFGIRRFRILVNMVNSPAEGRELFERLTAVAGRYLDVILHFCGAVPRDPLLVKSIRSQRALMSAYPGSPAALAFKNLGQIADKWTIPEKANGRLEFFVEQLVQHQPLDIGKALP
ncbi:MAG: MinD/ParA family protein, partial [Thiotrichales bacterium]|nr:MinD/ParA family protein [Thiotrichales bacterium]